MDTIEFEEPTYSTCDCCGEQTKHLVRFVARDDVEFAVYFADFSPGHDFVSVMVCYGDWGEGASSYNRIAFPFRIWKSEESYQVGWVDAADAAYNYEILGRVVDRSEALGHALKPEVFALSDHIVECDRPVIDFLTAANPIRTSSH